MKCTCDPFTLAYLGCRCSAQLWDEDEDEERPEPELEENPFDPYEGAGTFDWRRAPRLPRDASAPQVVGVAAARVRASRHEAGRASAEALRSDGAPPRNSRGRSETKGGREWASGPSAAEDRMRNRGT